MKRWIRVISWVIILAGAGVISVWAARKWTPDLLTPGTGAEYPGLILVALIAMSVATLGAVMVAFYLYRWRRWTLSAEPHFAPEAWMDRIQKLTKNQAQVVQTLVRLEERTQLELDTQGKRVENIMTMVMNMQRSLDEKDAEIHRLKRGYDAEVFRKFIRRFIRLHIAIVESANGEDVAHDELLMIKRLCEDALEECGIETVEPQVGADYRKTPGVADDPECLPTANPEDDFLITEVKTPGYRLITGEGEEYLREAVVSIQRFEPHEEATT